MSIEKTQSEAESQPSYLGGVVRIVSDVIKEGSIVWLKSSNQQIHCGRVDKIYPETNEALVFNFDAWTHWQVSFDNIVRVGVKHFNGDGYNEWMSRIQKFRGIVNKCNECSKELESGTVFCSVNCRQHYHQ